MGETRRISSDTGPFAIIPEWVLDHPGITPIAVRLYGVLARYADKDDATCYPSRRTLWTRLRCSERTLDSAVLCLEAVGALRVSARKSESGDRTSNLYQVVRIPPPELRGVGQNQPPPGAAVEPTGGAAAAVGTRPISEPEPENEKTPAEPVGSAMAKRKDDPLFEAVCAATGLDWRRVTPAMRGPLNSAVKGIRSVGGTPQEVHRRAAEYRVRMPDCELTPKALEKHWPRLNGDPRTVPGSTGSTLRAMAAIMAEQEGDQ